MKAHQTFGRADELMEGDACTDLLLTFGRANPFKEGDAHIGVAATSEAQRAAARAALREMCVGDLRSARFVQDEVSSLLDAAVDRDAAGRVASWSVGELVAFLLASAEGEIHRVAPGLSSEAIAAAVKLMSNEELTALSANIFNPPAGATFGARGYFGSRIQPNSPTDDPEEVLFSVLEGLSYGCGDVVLGVNPVASDWRNVARLERTLREVVRTFELSDATTYCVLAHIDDQLAAEDHAAREGAERGAPLVECGFQSIGGTASTNRTFNFDLRKLLSHLRRLRRQYFETGQGSEVTNGCACGIDMVTLEARSYGVARALALQTGNWTIVNDVSGFIGPEVFATAAQLERACLEDLAMGKLHGLAMGLDICSTMHMGVSVDELDAVTDALLRARPAYLMAVAGKSVRALPLRPRARTRRARRSAVPQAGPRGLSLAGPHALLHYHLVQGPRAPPAQARPARLGRDGALLFARRRDGRRRARPHDDAPRRRPAPPIRAPAARARRRARRGRAARRGGRDPAQAAGARPRPGPRARRRLRAAARRARRAAAQL